MDTKELKKVIAKRIKANVDEFIMPGIMDTIAEYSGDALAKADVKIDDDKIEFDRAINMIRGMYFEEIIAQLVNEATFKVSTVKIK